MITVIVESPYRGVGYLELKQNKEYLELCLKDCIARGESPYASHKMLTDCLDDTVKEERELGIAAGWAWRRAADKRVFFIDRGWSTGMLMTRDVYKSEGISYEVRDCVWDGSSSRLVHHPEAIVTGSGCGHLSPIGWCGCVGAKR